MTLTFVKSHFDHISVTRWRLGDNQSVRSLIPVVMAGGYDLEIG